MSQTIGKTRLAYTRLWHHTSLASPSTPSLGRIASRIAILLMGKHKPTFDASTDCGDYVVATDCSQLYTTGKKMQDKLYYSHTTRPGSLKTSSMEGLVKQWGGGEVLRRAVRGMLPKNRLRDVRMRRLKVFEGSKHPFRLNFVHVDGLPVEDFRATAATRIGPTPETRQIAGSGDGLSTTATASTSAPAA